MNVYKKRHLLNYIDSEKFLVDTMIHREGDKFVFLEPIPEDGLKHMEWINTHLFNCKHIVKHVGTRFQIADLIAKKLGIVKVDKKASKIYGEEVLTAEYSELDYVLADLPEVINEDEVK